MNPQQTIRQAALAALAAASSPKIKYLHHLKFPVADLDRSLIFYEQVFGAQILPDLTYKNEKGETYAYVLRISNFGPMLELWLNSRAAQAQAGYDFLTLAVKDCAALQHWIRHLDNLKIEHSQDVAGQGARPVTFEDPDGHRIRIQQQTDEEIEQKAG